MKRIAAIVAILGVVPLLAFGPQERTAATHWALIVGISDYINFDDVEGGDLPGAEHDARSVRDVLVMKGHVPEENVRLLLNQEATRDAIEEGVTGWLTENARPGDNVVIFFAGHGSQMWDESGDEDDGLDETLAPADVVANSTEFDISDDTFNSWLANLPTENVVVILDNCNSGTGTRDVTPFSRGRLLARDIAAIERPPSVTRRALPGQDDDTGFDAAETRVLELAAAQPHQVAVDAYFPAEDGSEAFHGGAFTTYLVRELWRASADETYQDVFEGAYEALKRNRFQQDPYLSEEVALKDEPLFFVEGGASANSDMSIPVASVNGAIAELGAGLALGITTGSIFETSSGALMTVERVGQRTTTARILQGSVDERDLARLAAHRYATTPLLVNVAAIDTRLAEALQVTLGATGGVRLIHEENAFSHLIVRRQGEELRVIGSDGFARHEGLAANPGAMNVLADALRKEASSKRLADMENPAQDFGLSLDLLDGQTSFGLGAEINFRVESERDGYLTLVDLGTDGTVSMLVPNAETPSVRIRAGQALTFPIEEGLYFEAQEPVGSGMVRVFVTPAPLDIEIAVGEVYAYGGEAFAGLIATALVQAVGSIENAVRLDTWGTASVVYEIHN